LPWQLLILNPALVTDQFHVTMENEVLTQVQV